MRVRPVSVLLARDAAVAAPALADRRSDAKSQVDVRHQVAAEGPLARGHLPLGEGCRDRSRPTARRGTTSASATNSSGKFDDARKAYEKALEVDPNNNYIRNNYDLFREIYDRQNRRRDR